MKPTNNTGRLAGLLYLLMGLPAPFSLLYVPGKLIVKGDAAATARNFLENQMLWQLGMIGHLISVTGFILLIMVLYRLLNGVNRMHASVMVILVVVSIPISLFSILNELAAVTLVRGAEYLSVFEKPQLDALALFFLVLRGKALIIAQIFWGLWLLPFGLLVMRSGFLPRILGVLLIVNGVAYVVASFAWLFLPAYAAMVDRIVFPALLGELWIMMWLLIKGAKVEPVTAVAPSMGAA